MTPLERAVEIASGWTDPNAWRLAYLERNNSTRLFRDRFQQWLAEDTPPTPDEMESQNAWAKFLADFHELREIVREHAVDLRNEVPLVRPRDAAPDVDALANQTGNLLALLRQRGANPKEKGTEDDTASTQSQPKPPATPRVMLSGWREILDAVGLRASDREKLKSLNSRFNGPIPNPGRGGQPVVDKGVLIDWYNGLAILQQELANQQAGARLSAESQYAHGTGQVVPELGGGVKRRKGRTKGK